MSGERSHSRRVLQMMELFGKSCYGRCTVFEGVRNIGPYDVERPVPGEDALFGKVNSGR